MEDIGIGILWAFGTFCGHLVCFMLTWYIFPLFGMLYQEKSDNPAEKLTCQEQQIKGGLIRDESKSAFWRRFGNAVAKFP
jgi:hypothetical protein